MTQFNPENKERIPHLEVFDPLFAITDVEDAKQYFEAYVAYQQKFIDSGEVDPKGKSARQIATENVGYWTGYMGADAKERIYRTLGIEHPFLKDAVRY